MSGIAKKSLAAAVVLGSAVLFLGSAVSYSQADGGKPDLSELRDAVKSAGKRGNNVDEVERALDALEKALAKGFKAPEPGKQLPPPPELAALRDAVETAGKKGENVEEIRKQLELVERAITGQVLVRPRPLPPSDAPPPPVRPNPRPGLPRDFPAMPAFPDFPNFPANPGIDRELLEKAQQLRLKAFELMMKEPNDEEAMKLLQEATELMLKALANGRGGLGGLGGLGGNPGLVLPDLPNLGGFGGLGGGAGGKFRLGVRLERLAPLTAEQLGLDGQGVAITSVIPGSPADRAGFKANDIVIEFGGKPVSDSPEDFTRRVFDAKVGEKVDVVVLRKGKKVELKGVELPAAQDDAARPEARPIPLPDLKLPPLPDGRGVVPNVRPLPLPAPDRGAKPGDPNGR